MTPGDVLAFWFGADASRPREEWFRKSDAFDEQIRARFEDAVERASRGELDAWAATPRGRLALVIVLDQFSRNLFRGSPRAFAGDARALALATQCIAAGDDARLGPFERQFLYMPLMHAEDPATQERSVAIFDRLAAGATPEASETLAAAARFARAHRDIVARFGRFPHRNAALGRASTPEEIAFLKTPGSSF